MRKDMQIKDINDKYDLLEYFESTEFDEDTDFYLEDKFQIMLACAGFSDVLYSMVMECIEHYENIIKKEDEDAK
jgi:hypothetical protein